MSQQSGRWALCRGCYSQEGLAKRIMVAYGVAGRTPVRKGMRPMPENGATSGIGTDAASARSSAGTLLEMATRFRRSFQSRCGPDK
jgi:hypothetical protein